jgi:hypothetical protein
LKVNQGSVGAAGKKIKPYYSLRDPATEKRKTRRNTVKVGETEREREIENKRER